MAGRRIVVVAGFLGVAAGIATVSRDSTGSRSSVTKDADGNVTHSLMICNAYASPKSLDVYSLTKEMKLTVEPLPYKGCREMSLDLEEGERLDFKAGGLSVGTFHCTGLPRTSAKLLLVPHRHSISALAASFASHAYSDSPGSAQLAVVDAYSGSAAGGVQIHQGRKRSKGGEEVLKPGTVVALTSGEYQVELADGEDKALITVPVTVGAETKHVALRVGVEGSYSQELVVFPNAKAAIIHSGSTRVCPVLGALFSVVAYSFVLA
mmetsp:Transcript_127825/g.343050  ORF Transcript_127825/g.343050 Transcript_127825/m.343050 type:complete len:265 (+) Transcript_127825:59-853(+)